MKMSWIKKHKIITLISVNALLFILVFLILEVSARIIFPEQKAFFHDRNEFWQYDSTLGWKLVPNSNGNHLHSSFEIKIQINSKSLRDDEYDYKRNDKKRMLLLGDSFAWGFGTKDEDRYSELLETKLVNWEVINAGIPGYSTDQQFLYYKNEGYKYNPDVVMLLFYENDFFGNTLETIHWYNKPYFNVEGENLILKNVPVPEQTLYQKIRSFLSGKSYLVSLVFRRITLLNINSYSYDDFSFSNSALITKKIIEKLYFETVKNDSEFLLVNIPMDSVKTATLQELSHKHSFKYLDLSPYFNNKENYLIEDDGHWNAKGHKIAADAVYSWLN